MSVTDPEAAPVIKKEHKANSRDIEKLESVYGIAPEVIEDYGYIKHGKGYIEYETDSCVFRSIPVHQVR